MSSSSSGKRLGIDEYSKYAEMSLLFEDCSIFMKVEKAISRNAGRTTTKSGNCSCDLTASGNLNSLKSSKFSAFSHPSYSPYGAKATQTILLPNFVPRNSLVHFFIAGQLFKAPIESKQKLINK